MKPVEAHLRTFHVKIVSAVCLNVQGLHIRRISLPSVVLCKFNSFAVFDNRVKSVPGVIYAPSPTARNSLPLPITAPTFSEPSCRLEIHSMFQKQELYHLLRKQHCCFLVCRQQFRKVSVAFILLESGSGVTVMFSTSVVTMLSSVLNHRQVQREVPCALARSRPYSSCY